MQMNRLALRFADGRLSVDSRRLNAAITTLLLTSSEDSAVRRQCLQGIAKGQYRLDAKLVLSLYAACDAAEQVELACSPAVDRLPLREFRRVFDEVHARADLSNKQRAELAWTLEAYLWRNPRHVPKFAPVIRSLLRNSRRSLRRRALSMMGLSKRLEDGDLAILQKSLRARAPDLRGNALSALCTMMMDFAELAPALQAYLASRELRIVTQQLLRSDPDERVRGNAHCLQRWVQHSLKGGPSPHCAVMIF